MQIFSLKSFEWQSLTKNDRDSVIAASDKAQHLAGRVRVCRDVPSFPHRHSAYVCVRLFKHSCMLVSVCALVCVSDMPCVCVCERENEIGLKG